MLKFFVALAVVMGVPNIMIVVIEFCKMKLGDIADVRMGYPSGRALSTIRWAMSR